jgi:hypothetical protein
MLIQAQVGWLAILLSFPHQLPSGTTGATPEPSGPISGDKVPVGKYTGKLLSLPSMDGAFTLEITTKKLEPKPNAQYFAQLTAKFQQDYQNGLNSIQRDLATGRDSAYHQARLRDHLLWGQRNAPAYAPGGSHSPYEIKDVVQNVDFHASKSFKVRFKNLPEAFTENGKPKKYSATELQKLKGKDASLPGYEAKPEDLNTGALVRVTLVNAKPPTKEEREAGGTANRPKRVVTLILIVSKDGKLELKPTSVGIRQ